MKPCAGLLMLALALIPVSLAGAGGAGGVGFSGQYFHSSLSSADLGLTELTGFGYGVSDDGTRTGGFGTALLSSTSDISGGVGGMLVGHEWRAGPVVAAVTLWGGLGGADWGAEGYFLAYGSAQAELGAWVLPWMQVTAFVAYEVLGNLLPGAPFRRATLATPSLGIRIAWGGP